MSRLKIYPAIDLMNGRCVRLSQGNFDASTVYAGDPLETAQAYEHAGAQCIHVVDLDGARESNARQTQAILRIARETKLRVQTGGGIRSADDVRARLAGGASQIVLGSLAVTDRRRALEIVREFGAGQFTIALDFRLDLEGTPVLQSRGWVDSVTLAFDDALAFWLDAGVPRFLCTDVGRDGMMQGPNQRFYADLAHRHPGVEFQASGGIGSLEDVQRLAAAGVPAAIIGKALFEGRFKLSEALSGALSC